MKILNKGQNSMSVGGKYQLRPGEITDIDDKDWKELYKYPFYQNMVATGEYELLGSSKKEDKVEEEIDSLSSLNWNKATDLVESTHDSELLSRWAKKDKRPSVQKAIKNQLETLNAE